MRDSKEIKEEIDKLQKEYKEALLNESKILLIDDKKQGQPWRDDRIGFFEMGKQKSFLEN